MNIKRIENAHVAFWLLKDFSWCTSIKWLGLIMIIPTLSLAVRLASHTRKDAEDFVHNLATCFWIIANCIWMFGEFFYNDQTRHAAQFFFVAGLAVLGSYYAWCGIKQFRAAR